jgi:hypothetical protein
MAFKELSAQRYQGFFDYTDNNVIEGTTVEDNITGKTESGAETGYVAIKLSKPCEAKLDDASFTAQPGDVIAISITNATRVMVGLKRGTLVRCTFLGFKANKRNPTKKYHSWRIEVDDEPTQQVV